MKSVEQNCEEHAKHKPEFDVFSVIVACKLHNLAACCVHWIVQHLMIILLCTGELRKHVKLPTKHIHEKNIHLSQVSSSTCYAQIHLLVICQRILISYQQISSHTSESSMWYYFPSQSFYT